MHSDIACSTQQQRDQVDQTTASSNQGVADTAVGLEHLSQVALAFLPLLDRRRMDGHELVDEVLHDAVLAYWTGGNVASEHHDLAHLPGDNG